MLASMSITPGDIEEAYRIFDELGFARSEIRWALSPSADRWCLFRQDTGEMVACRIYPSLEWTDPE